MDSEEPKYYAAYDERYKTAHRNGVSWSSDRSTPIVCETLRAHRIRPDQSLLEIGCGEGRDARAVLDAGYNLLATDLSEEAIAYCRARMPQYSDRFRRMDCLSDEPGKTFDFIYAVAVIHMLVLDDDRAKFYQFIRDHLKPDGLALICTMGDGTEERQSDVRRAFELQERNHPSGKMLVAATSCRMVSFPTFTGELTSADLEIIEQGITESLPDFDRLMYAVVKKKEAGGRHGTATDPSDENL